MKRKIIISLSLILSLMMVLCIFASCGKKEEAPQSSAPVSSKVEEPSSSVEDSSKVPESSEQPEVVPSENTSLTTGITYDTPQTFYPVQVQIENSSAARPQTGLNEADIIYEAPVEGTITRFTVIFNDNHPVVAGPVRSLRMNFLGIQREWDSILVHYGGPDVKGEEYSIYGKDYDSIQYTCNGVWGGKHTKFFWRSSDRKAPHNAYTNVQFIKETYPDFKSKKTEFWKHSETPTGSDKTATSILVPFLKSTPGIEFRYNKDTDSYDRYEDGKRFETYRNSDKEKRSLEYVSVKNLIIQYVPMRTANDSDGHRIIYMTGKGKCDVFIGGKWITGTWERKEDTALTHFYDENGKDITLAIGNTWVCVQPDSNKITVK
ncbi:MAG: DUF3048 domain-containing protein [Clostridia bacterium]|nr:DUF3048 domain-containing protein [Clostridia bacterium]